MRQDGRLPHQMRPVALTRQYNIHAEGSVLIEVGRTRVICTATVEERVPPFMRGRGEGWITAEYGMLPACNGRAHASARLPGAGRAAARWRSSG